MNNKNRVGVLPQDIPDDWEIIKFRRVADRIKKRSGTGDLLSVYLNEGVIPFAQGGEDRVHNPSEDMGLYQVVNPGQLVMNNQQAWRGSVGVSTLDGIISPAYHIYDISPKLHYRFASYLFRSRPMVLQYDLSSRGVGTIQKNLDESTLKDIFVPVPPLEEQRRIADYLDTQIATLSNLINSKRLQIEQVSEFRREETQRLIFGTDVLCVPSSIRNSSELADPFSRELPKGWKRTKFRYVTSASSLPSGGVGNLLSVYLNEGVIPFSQGGEDRVHNPSEDMSKYQVVKSGYLVMNNQQAWRGSVGVSSLEGIISPAYHIYRLSDELNPSFANLLFRSRPMVFLYEQVSRGVGNIQRNLDGSSLKNIPVIFPEIQSQIKIVKAVADASGTLETTLQRLGESISKLEEFRGSLITAAVTGTFDVTTGRSVA